MDTSTEFPADNPLLGAGSAWVCSSTRGRALATRRRMVLVTPILLMPEGAVPPPHSLPAAAVVVAAPIAPAAVAVKATAAQDPFQTFVQALAQSLLSSGHTRAAAALPALLESGRLQGDDLGPEAVASLRQRGILEREGLALTDGFRARAEAWRQVLCGTSDDLSACGDATLDGWSSELLCALSATPATRAGDYRRELRKRGVAAFGLLAVAA